MLAYKYRLTLPETAAGKPIQQQQQRGGRGLPHQAPTNSTAGPCSCRIVSLHSIGRTMYGCCAAAVGPRLLIFEAPLLNAAGTATAASPRPRHNWSAVAPAAPSGCIITSLHSSATSGLLLSGASDGSIAMWNVRDRPGGAPVGILRSSPSISSGPVTALQLMNSHTLAAAYGGSGGVLIWDIRSTSAPLQALLTHAGSASVMKVIMTWVFFGLFSSGTCYCGKGKGGDFTLTPAGRKQHERNLCQVTKKKRPKHSTQISKPF
jgi:hypothetical protein